MDSNRIKVGLYLDGANIQNWSMTTFLKGEIGLSGTTNQAIWLANALHHCNNFEFYLYSDVKLEPYNNLNMVTVGNLENAIRHASRQELDILIINLGHNKCYYNALRIGNNLKIKMVIWAQNSPAKEMDSFLSDHNYIRRVVMVSKSQYHSFRHWASFHKFTCIYNGIPIKDVENGITVVSNTQDWPVIGYIGVPNETKGFHWVCMAWPSIRKQYPKAILKVMGGIQLHDKNRIVGESGIAEPAFEKKYIHPYLGNTIDIRHKNGVQLLGCISSNLLKDHISTCTLGIVNPNVKECIETFCVSALDFQAQGIPVIGGKAGGLLETIAHGFTGQLIKQPAHLSKQVIRLLGKPKKLKYLGINGNYFVRKHFDIEFVHQGFIELIKDVVENKPTTLIPLQKTFISANILIKEILRLKQRFRRAMPKRDYLN